MDKDLKIIYGIWIFIVVSLFGMIQLLPLFSASPAIVDDIISYYKSDEQDTTGSGTIYDALGINNGANAGADNSTGKINTAYDFTRASSDYISIDGLVTSLASCTAGTISQWIKLETDNSQINTGFAISRDADSTLTEMHLQYDFRATADRLVVGLYVDGTGQWVVSTDVDSLDVHVGNWLFVTVTHNGTSVLIYFNGTSQNLNWHVELDKTKWFKAILTDATSDADTVNLGTSERNGAEVFPYEGIIDEDGIWCEAKTANEVSSLWNNGDGLAYPFGPDEIPPTYSTNQTNTTAAGESCLFSILYNDVALHPSGQYIFSTNNTGVWTNESAVNFTETPQWANVTKTLNSTVGTVVGYRWFADDNEGNVNNTGIYTLTTTYLSLEIKDPTTANPSNVSSGDNITITFLFLEDSSNITSDVEINNITIGGTQANVVTSSGEPFAYYDDFETDFGHWAVHEGINCPDADAWGDRGISTTSGGTGPQSGGVGGAGTYFIFVETSSGNCYDTGDMAIVYFNETIDYDSFTDEKIEFYFDAYGATIDKLAVEENSTGSWVEVWSMADINNDYWNFTSVDLSSLTGNGTLRFNYTRTSTGYTSDIALDRINVTGQGGVEEFAWIAGSGWNVNVTVPTLESGLKDLFVKANYTGYARNDTESNAINYEVAVDTCTCPNNPATGWEIDMEDYCVLSENCVCDALTFINTGNFTCNSTLNASSVGGLASGQRGYVTSNCRGIDR